MSKGIGRPKSRILTCRELDAENSLQTLWKIHPDGERILPVSMAIAIPPQRPEFPFAAKTQSETRRHRPILTALITAAIIHGLLFTIPIEFFERTPKQAAPIYLKIFPPPPRDAEPATPPPATTAPEVPSNPSANHTLPKRSAAQQPAAIEPTRSQKRSAPPPITTRATPREKSTDETPRQVPVPSTEGSHPQVESGAKTRSTVFDPRLSQQLDDVRNQVQKFEVLNSEHSTDNGRFVQKGNKCWEERKLLPGDIDSNVTQRFNIKCSKRRRSQEDIDRLARKYGIP